MYKVKVVEPFQNKRVEYLKEKKYISETYVETWMDLGKFMAVFLT
jgi:hypothetical protein